MINAKIIDSHQESYFKIFTEDKNILNFLFLIFLNHNYQGEPVLIFK